MYDFKVCQKGIYKMKISLQIHHKIYSSYVLRKDIEEMVSEITYLELLTV